MHKIWLTIYTSTAQWKASLERPPSTSLLSPLQAIFENYVVMEVIKHRYNRGLLDGVYFYRDSNQNEVDILLKEEGEITAIEVKSSMTYHSSFEDSISKLAEWIKTPISNKLIVYTGDFENTTANIKVLNYRHLQAYLPHLE